MHFRAILISSLLLSSCIAMYPGGRTSDEWQALSPEQRQAIMAEEKRQQEIARKEREARIIAEREQQLKLNRIRLEDNVRHRLGITEAEWKKMPADKQLALRQEQEAIERSEYNNMMMAEQQSRAQSAAVDAEARAAESQRQIADAIRERNRQELYSNATHGNVVNCTIQGGKAKFRVGFASTKWTEIAPTRFEIAKTDAKYVDVQRADRLKTTTNFWVSFRDNSNLQFCPSEGVDMKYKTCRSHAVTSAFEQGYTASFNIPGVMEGNTISCSFAPGRK